MEYVNEFLDVYESTMINAKENAELIVNYNSNDVEYIDGYDFFFGEMAEIIPDMNKCDEYYKRKGFGFRIKVMQRNEGTNDPHVHIEFINGKNKIAYISLNSATYSAHHLKNTRILSPDEIDALVVFFNTPIKSVLNKSETCWERAADTYISTFGDPYKVFKYKNGNLVMPDYTRLNINYHENNNEDPDFPRKKIDVLKESVTAEDVMILKFRREYNIINKKDKEIICKIEFVDYDMPGFDWILIHDVETKLAYRHKGLASLLLDEIYKDIILEMNPNKGLYVFVKSDNEVAMNLYNKCGFKMVKKYKKDEYLYNIMCKGNADIKQFDNMNFNVD